MERTRVKLEYEIMWETKNKILDNDTKIKIREIIRQTCKIMNVRIISGKISNKYVCMKISSPTTIAIAKIVQELKGKTARKILCEKENHLWEKGYLCRSM